MEYIDAIQGSDEWFECRLGLATNSKAGTWMANYGKSFGLPAQDYALQLALERVTGKKSEFSFSNDHMVRGILQEPEAIMLYEDTYFVDVEPCGFFDCGLYGGSPDSLISDDGCIEVKSVTAKVHYATLTRGSFDPAYRWQMLSHIDVSGRDYCDFISYCSDFPEDLRLIVHRLHRSEHLEDLEKLKERRNDFLIMVDEIESKLKGNDE